MIVTPPEGLTEWTIVPLISSASAPTLTPTNQKKFHYGRYFKHLKNNKCSLTISSLAIGLVAGGLYFDTKWLLNYQGPNIGVKNMAVFVDIVMFVGGCFCALSVVKHCRKAVKNGRTHAAAGFDEEIQPLI